VLDIIPVAAAETDEEAKASASPQLPAILINLRRHPHRFRKSRRLNRRQVHAEVVNPSTSERPKDPADAPPQTKPGSGPLHA
jgi:methyl coenzyme M reductase subunit C-like uncharacterized protein (methanogenesis marker protein 7)